MNELVSVDMSQFGLEETKAIEIRKDFEAVLKIASELESDYNELVKKEISMDVCAEAKKLRLKYVKVRTGIAKVHKERKAFYLSGGRAVDGLKNAYTHAVEGNEAKLREIETHYDRIEAERIAKLQDERSEIIKAIDPESPDTDFASMSDDVWDNYRNGVQLATDQRKEAERKAEEERIAKEKEEREERERVAKENAKLKAEAEKREKAERARRAKEEAERKRVEAEREKERKEAEARIKKEREERERIEAEAKAKEEAERKAKADAEARERDTEHRKKINNEALNSIVDNCDGIDNISAKLIVKAIASGKIANVVINY